MDQFQIAAPAVLAAMVKRKSSQYDVAHFRFER